MDEDAIRRLIAHEIEKAVDSARQEWEAYADQTKAELQDEINRLETQFEDFD